MVDNIQHACYNRHVPTTKDNKMAIVNFNLEDFKYAESEAEKKAMVEAWQEYTYNEPVILNEKSAGYSCYKSMIAESVLHCFLYAKYDLQKLHGQADIEDEDDYKFIVERMVMKLKERAN